MEECVKNDVCKIKNFLILKKSILTDWENGKLKLFVEDIIVKAHESIGAPFAEDFSLFNYNYFFTSKNVRIFKNVGNASIVFNGKAMEPNFSFVLKSDINAYLEGDLDLIKMLEKKVYHEECVSVLESILNELKQRTWQLRDFISWEKFIGGQ